MTSKSKSKSKPKAPEAKKAGVTTTAKMLLIANEMAISLDDLCSELEKKGFTVSRSSIQTLMGDFRQSVRVLHEAGKLKGLTPTARLVKSEPREQEARELMKDPKAKKDWEALAPQKKPKASKKKAAKAEPEVKTELKAEAA